jgi:hypothetical protein
MECENDDGEACQPGTGAPPMTRGGKTPGIDDGRYRQAAGIVRRSWKGLGGVYRAGALPGIKFRNSCDHAAPPARQAMYGQRSLLLPDLCGSESDAEIRGYLLPRGEFALWQFEQLE